MTLCVWAHLRKHAHHACSTAAGRVHAPARPDCAGQVVPVRHMQSDAEESNVQWFDLTRVCTSRPDVEEALCYQLLGRAPSKEVSPVRAFWKDGRMCVGPIAVERHCQQNVGGASGEGAQSMVCMGLFLCGRTALPAELGGGHGEGAQSMMCMGPSFALTKG
eukprot:524254-Pelagomonas_calceolata.AAC.2